MKTHSSRQDAYINQTYVLLLVEYIKHHHPQPDGMLHTLGIVQNTAPSDERIPLSDFTKMLKRIEQEMNEPHLAIEMARHITAAHFGVLGYLILACANLGEALALLTRYARLLNDHFVMKTHIEDDILILTWDFSDLKDLLFYELGLAAMMQFTNHLIGINASTLEVHLRSPRPQNPAYYEEFYGCPVFFDQKDMVIKLPAQLLTTPVKQPDRILLDLLSKQADQALAALPQQDGEWAQKVRQEIVRLCHEDTPTLTKVANQFYVTPRTLQRHLNDEGFSFQVLLDDTRRHLAEQYLQDHRLQLTDIADLLGYSDQSALTRAFKRWTGNTPKLIRKNS